MTPRAVSRATITGPRRWRRRPSTRRQTAASRSGSPSGWRGGRSKERRKAMAEPIDSWEKAVAFALSLPGTELSTSYGKPAVKVNGRAFLYTGHEDKTSFGVGIDMDSVELLKETDPDTFWQTLHYEGWPAVLIRYDSADPERVRSVIERSRDWTAAKPPPRPRKKRKK